jgi:D-arabinose 1-dehydrogenase-like Zn-dependent alcohol dehydrogenase
VAAVSRGRDNESLARKLGAHIYIDSSATNAAQELQKLGGADAILGTAPSSKAMTSLVDGLAKTALFSLSAQARTRSSQPLLN